MWDAIFDGSLSEALKYWEKRLFIEPWENKPEIYYTLTRKAKAYLAYVKHHGRASNYDKVTINEILPYLSPYGVNDLNKYIEIALELEHELKIKPIKQFLYRENFCTELESDNVEFTNRGRKLQQLGSIQAYRNYVKDRKTILAKKEGLEIAILDIQKKQAVFNTILVIATVVSILISTTALIFQWVAIKDARAIESKNKQTQSKIEALEERIPPLQQRPSPPKAATDTASNK